jgi:hypothetical protein
MNLELHFEEIGPRTIIQVLITLEIRFQKSFERLQAPVNNYFIKTYSLKNKFIRNAVSKFSF